MTSVAVPGGLLCATSSRDSRRACLHPDIAALKKTKGLIEYWMLHGIMNNISLDILLDGFGHTQERLGVLFTYA